jgi:Zn-finger nucleic acid-binding protein
VAAGVVAVCPQCREPLIVVEFEGIEVDHCVSCRGTWLDGGELELISEMAGAPRGGLEQALRDAGAGTRGGRRCPRCRRKMRLISVGTAPAVELDRCPVGHGLWLDTGELVTLVREFGGSADAVVADFR